MQERVAGCRTFPGAGYISLLFYNHFVYPVYIRRTESWLRWLLKLSVLHITNLWGPRAFMAQVEAPWRGAVPWTTTSSTPQLLLWGSTTSENAQPRALQGRNRGRTPIHTPLHVCEVQKAYELWVEFSSNYCFQAPGAPMLAVPGVACWGRMCLSVCPFRHKWIGWAA